MSDHEEHIEHLKRKLQEAKDDAGAWRQRAEQAEAELEVLQEKLAEIEGKPVTDDDWGNGANFR
jgi:predicted nuclease with TOPRIM domain